MICNWTDSDPITDLVELALDQSGIEPDELITDHSLKMAIIPIIGSSIRSPGDIVIF